ncbi:biotin-dependent carboxyltransferase family protein [Rhizobium sp. GN54]|uniref:5-oxoprolinase subunit C family protein n=1 Tax=Rhizobium sp. GN54 TaxID=2898150 RepID=UPI001E4BB6CC|nr:biotin-dependent carboxyltransferase family protein [Rhizobium sp. GN54]MCD2185062.1 biotin-dependent carboxyltransferase family protein [Rhizobium sp. GN54]
MTVLLIGQAGPMVTVQDRGRSGLLHAGVSGSGPMDGPSMDIANALAGNGPDCAVLEFAGSGGVFEVTEPVRFAVAGGAVDIRIDGVAAFPWESHHLLPGRKLTIGAMRDAVWGYLAFSGGIDTPPVLGSRATHLRSGLGGLEGRRLAANDRLPLGIAKAAPLLAFRRFWQQVRGPIRVVPGPQDDYFDRSVWRTFLDEPFIVSPSRDRMAQILDGPLLPAARGHDIVSDGTLAGSIQVPASGRPIVLMAERQTTGGYPKIATVASVDLPRLAQTPSGRRVRFAAVSQEEAEDLLIDGRRALADAIAGMTEKPPDATLS